MSKKLLMNNYSEKGLMPVTDGLICWLDGRDGENGDNIWRDRSGNGNDGILYNFDESSFHNGYLVSKNVINYIELFKNISINDKTFIINTEVDSGNNINMLMGGWEHALAGKHCFGIMNRYPDWSRTSMIWALGNASPNVLSSFDYIGKYTNIAVTIANNQVKLFINGELKATSNLSQELIMDNFYLFRKDDEINNCCRATLGSFMAYDRPLTEEEVQQNYLYEQSIKRG